MIGLLVLVQHTNSKTGGIVMANLVCEYWYKSFVHSYDYEFLIPAIEYQLAKKVVMYTSC